jgi:hypothetical protein
MRNIQGLFEKLESKNMFFNLSLLFVFKVTSRANIRNFVILFGIEFSIQAVQTFCELSLLDVLFKQTWKQKINSYVQKNLSIEILTISAFSQRKVDLNIQ